MAPAEKTRKSVHGTRISFLVLDIAIWLVAVPLAALMRYEFSLTNISWGPLIGVAVIAAAVHLVVGYFVGVYRGRHGFGTFDEVRSMTLSVAVVTVVMSLFLLIVGPLWDVPRTTMLIAGPMALILILGARYVFRANLESRLGPGEGASPTLIYGAGVLGETMVRRMQVDSDGAFRPVAMLDDDPSLKSRVIRGVPVMGTLEDLPKVVERTGAADLIVAISAADQHLVRRVADVATPAGVHVRLLPQLSQELASHANLSDLRDLSIEDILGRDPVDTSVNDAAAYVRGKKVLVTGAGGSIGSELCRQLTRFEPAELIMLDRDETALQEVQISITGHGLLDTKEVVLADIRDKDALQAIFTERRPDVVYHAAALKHLPMLEQYPNEAWKSNVLGTLNVLEAAHASGVQKFVNISTDKAANPTSSLGHSKRVAEMLTAWMAKETGLPYLSVRFGNVIGSRGSMLPTFRSLIEKGGPVTVTHPDATRYFMTIPEACQLVIQAGAIGRPGEVMILDMGEPVKILDVAQRMVKMSGKDVAIKFTGLREGEKLHEILIGTGEHDERPFHPKISHATVESISKDDLDREEWLRRLGAVRAASAPGDQA